MNLYKTNPIVGFIRKSNTTFNWRMTECYICYSEYGPTPRAFPFDCDHEICKECFFTYKKHNHTIVKPIVCGMCAKPIRLEWDTMQIMRPRELAPNEWIWTSDIDLVTKTNPPELQLDILQYQLSHGISHPLRHEPNILQRNRFIKWFKKMVNL